MARLAYEELVKVEDDVTFLIRDLAALQLVLYSKGKHTDLAMAKDLASVAEKMKIVLGFID